MLARGVLLLELGKRIKELRRDKGITQAELAKILNVTRATVNNWENKGSSPSNDVSVNIAKYFNITLEYLLSGDDFVPNENIVTKTEMDRFIESLYKLNRADFDMVKFIVSCMIEKRV